MEEETKETPEEIPEETEQDIYKELVSFRKSKQRRVYYTKDGRETRPLPSDIFSRLQYEAKGFSIHPPKTTPNPDAAVECPICKAKTKNVEDLKVHLGSHIEEKEEDNGIN
jgi:hypothetical protein